MLPKEYTKEEVDEMHNVYRFLALSNKAEMSSVMARGFGSYGVMIEFLNEKDALEFHERFEKLKK